MTKNYENAADLSQMRARN